MSSTADRRTLPALLALTPGDVASALAFDDLERAVGRACDAGLRGLVVREPLLEDGPYTELFARLARVFHAVDGFVAVHDRVHLAAALEVDGVHLAAHSLAPSAARDMLDDSIAIGFSSHAGDDASRWEGVDWLFHSPIRATPSKPDAEPLGFDALAAFCDATDLPVFALGGMQPGDLAVARAHGAHGIAVLSGILAASDPAAAVRSHLDA